MTYTYISARLRSGLSLQQPTGTWTNGYTWDAAHRLSTETSPAGTFTYSYRDSQPSTLIKKLYLPNTSYITNTYDSVARLTGTYLDDSSNTVLDKSEYLYNTANQRIRLTRTDASYYTNNYDNIGQLITADSTVASEDRGYGYDAAWNLNKRTNNATVYTFTVDVKNQLISSPSGSCTYDSNGNLTANGITGYAYDAENQLTNAAWVASDALSGQRSDFAYDGRGRLRVRLDYFWQNTGGTNGIWSPGGEVRYVCDGMRVIQERSSANTPTVSYVRGSDLSGTLEGAGGIGGLLARSHNYVSGTGAWNSHGYYHADGGGNITYLANPSQGLAASYKYDPFGNTIALSGTNASANVYRFSSKEYMASAANYYYGYRFYDPNLQRWLNRDPIGELGGINLYEFAQNNPDAWIDPTGTISLRKWFCMVVTALGIECSDEHKPPPTPVSAQQEQVIKDEAEKIKNRGRGRAVKGAGSKCLIGLALLPGLAEDADRLYRAHESDRSYIDQLKNDVQGFPSLDTPFGVLPNPYYKQWDPNFIY